MHIADDRLHLQCFVASVIYRELWSAIKGLCDDACHDCSVDHLSEIQPDWCMMATDEESFDMFWDSALSSLDIEAIFTNEFLVYYSRSGIGLLEN